MNSTNRFGTLVTYTNSGDTTIATNASIYFDTSARLKNNATGVTRLPGLPASNVTNALTLSDKSYLKTWRAGATGSQIINTGDVVVTANATAYIEIPIIDDTAAKSVKVNTGATLIYQILDSNANPIATHKVGPNTGARLNNGFDIEDNQLTGLAGSSITGDGTITWPTTEIGGLVSPGDPATAALLTFNGNYTQDLAGSLALKLGLTSSDKLAVTHDVVLHGALSLSLLPGFNANVGDRFTLLDNQSLDAIDGTFAGLPEGADLNVDGWLFQLSYVGGTGNDVTLSVLGTAPITLAFSSDPSAYGQPVTLTATLHPNSGTLPTGNVVFFNGTNQIGTGVVTQGPLGSTATIVTSTLPLGDNTITAVYSGDVNYLTSTSTALIETIQQDSSTVVLTADNDPTVIGQTVHLTATVSPTTFGGNPSGSVGFFADGTLVATVPVTQGSLGSQATFSTSALLLGDHTIVAVYSGDPYFTGATSGALTETVQQADSSTALTASSDPSVINQAVTFTATVSSLFLAANPTGTVTFSSNGTALATVPLTNGMSGAQATFTTSTLALGYDDVIAVYSGDSTFVSSTSADLIEAIQQADSTTSLTTNISPSFVGQAVTFTASISSSYLGISPTGTVLFYNGLTLLGSVPLTTGMMGSQASITTSTLPLGGNVITAVYSGDATFLTSTSSVLNETVQQATTFTSLTESSPTSAPGQAVTFTATVSSSYLGSPPTGPVNFVDGTTLLGTGTLIHGMMGTQATYTTSTLPLGGHTITAVYNGDSANLGSSSSALSETVQQTTPFISLSASTLTSNAGQAVTFTATVTAPPPGTNPNGSVTFMEGMTNLGTVTLTPGMMGMQASLTTSTLGVGNHNITAVFSGNATYASITSSAVTETVQQASTPTTWTSLSTSSQYALAGQAVTFTAMVTRSGMGAMPTGSVTFSDGNVSLGVVALSSYMGMGGQAVLIISNLSVGNHTIKAVYSGDSTYTGSTSNTIAETVQRTSVMEMESTSNYSALFGQAVTFTATIYSMGGVAPTGTVSFWDGSTLLGTINLSQVGTNYQAAFTISTLSRGSHTIVAVYSGDQDFNSTSASVGETIS